MSLTTNKRFRNSRRVLLAALLILVVGSTGCASLVDWNKVNPLGGNLNDQPQSLDVQFGLARMVERSGSLSDARDLYQQILIKHPQDSNTLHRLGVVSIQLDQLEDAIDLLNRAAAAGQPDADLLGDLGYAYFLSGDLKSAEWKLRDAVAMAPQNRRNLNNLGIVVGYQGNLEECLEWFRRGNTEAEAQANLAFVLTGLGDMEAAKQRYHNALDLDPSLKKAAYGLSEFYQPHPQPRRPIAADGEWTPPFADSAESVEEKINSKS